MELRHLRYFIAVAEELHFSRAAERLHIEQSPLSRTIKKLESDLGVILLERTTRGTRLTWAGQVFLEDARRIVVSFEQAKANAKSAAKGNRGALRVALSGSIARSHLSSLLALCLQEEPEVGIWLSEVSVYQQLKGMRNDLYDTGFTFSDEVEDGIVAEPVWRDPLILVMPIRHPLLVHKRVPLEEAMKYPLVLCHPEMCTGYSLQLARFLRSVDAQPTVIERVATHDLMLTLVAAGYGIGFSSAAHVAARQTSDVVGRPLADCDFLLTTYLLRLDNEPSQQLNNFIQRVGKVSP